MANWKKIEQAAYRMVVLQEELAALRGKKKVVAKNKVPFILYSRPWESIVIKVKKEK